MELKHPAQLLFSEKHPLTAILNMVFEGSEARTLTVSLEAPETFADVNGEMLHTGFSTLILDTIMGACAIGELEKLMPIATVKLNCNHLGRARVGEALTCMAIYDGEENGLAYVSGRIVGGPEQRLIAKAVGTFMLGTAAKPLTVKS